MQSGGGGGGSHQIAAVVRNPKPISPFFFGSNYKNQWRTLEYSRTLINIKNPVTTKHQNFRFSSLTNSNTYIFQQKFTYHFRFIHNHKPSLKSGQTLITSETSSSYIRTTNRPHHNNPKQDRIEWREKDQSQTEVQKRRGRPDHKQAKRSRSEPNRSINLDFRFVEFLFFV